MDNWSAPFVNILAMEYHVFTFDNRGMGYSGDNNATPTIQQYADDAAGLMHALGFASMNTYGTSMGSTISQQLVISHPEVVRKMVLSSATYSVFIPETQLLLSILQSVAADPTQPQGLRNEALANLAWNGSWAGLPGIQKPVMLIVGTADALTPDQVSVQIAGQINGSWLLRFLNIPHSGQSYAPIQYAESVLTFLDMNESPYVDTAPGAPFGLMALAGNGQIALTWNAPLNDGNSSITGYHVFRSAAADGAYALVATAYGTNYTDGGISNGQTYWYKVSAANAIGNGPDSTPVGAKPQQPTDSLVLPLGVVLGVLLVILIIVVAVKKK
jgi:hypothetical protein